MTELTLTDEQIKREIRDFGERIKYAKDKLTAQPFSAGTWQGRKKLKAQRKALREEISHVQSLIRIAQEALEDGLYD